MTRSINQQASMRAALVRYTRIATASAAFALIAACGDGGDDDNNSTPTGGVKLQIVSFGDSLSDVGTYSPGAASNFGGGRFTTNPGQVWVQNVAQYCGDALTPAMTGGFGTAPAAQSGLGYAQGGSRVTNPIGIGQLCGRADGAGRSAGDELSLRARQLQRESARDRQRRRERHSVQLAGGAAGQTTPAAATAAIGQAAIDLAGVSARSCRAAQRTCWSRTYRTSARRRRAYEQRDNARVSHVGIAQLQSGVGGSADADGLDVQGDLSGANITANFGQFGFTVSNTGTACNLQAMATAAAKFGEPNPQAFATSLFCSPETLTVKGGDQTYMGASDDAFAYALCADCGADGG